MQITVTRYHDFSMGHALSDYDGPCRNLHGHNYRIHFTLAVDTEDLDSTGMVVDFGVIKSVLCEYIERNLDHKFMLHEKDYRAPQLKDLDPESLFLVPFNPTAENIARHVLEKCSPLIENYQVKLIRILLEETRKCSTEIIK